MKKYRKEELFRTVIIFRTGKKWDLRILDPEEHFSNPQIEEHFEQSPAHLDFKAGELYYKCKSSSNVPYLPLLMNSNPRI